MNIVRKINKNDDQMKTVYISTTNKNTEPDIFPKSNRQEDETVFVLKKPGQIQYSSIAPLVKHYQSILQQHEPKNDEISRKKQLNYLSHILFSTIIHRH
jgi:hypothetical protein